MTEPMDHYVQHLTDDTIVCRCERVTAGQTVATIEAMKMEASITTPVAGTVRRVAIGAVQQLEGGDLVMVVA